MCFNFAAFCIDSSSRRLSNQYLIRDHMAAHYNRILQARGKNVYMWKIYIHFCVFMWTVWRLCEPSMWTVFIQIVLPPFNMYFIITEMGYMCNKVQRLTFWIVKCICFEQQHIWVRKADYRCICSDSNLAEKQMCMRCRSVCQMCTMLEKGYSSKGEQVFACRKS